MWVMIDCFFKICVYDSNYYYYWCIFFIKKNVVMFVFVVNNIVILYVEFGINFSVNMYVMIFYI